MSPSTPFRHNAAGTEDGSVLGAARQAFLGAVRDAFGDGVEIVSALQLVIRRLRQIEQGIVELASNGVTARRSGTWAGSIRTRSLR